MTVVTGSEDIMENTLLIAEDDSTSRRILCEALAKDGYRILDVGDGTAALDIIEREHIDVLLTDVVMPGMNGIELLERARLVQPNFRAIIMSGNSTPEAVIGAFRNQACDFLSKPFGVDELRTAVRSALERNVKCQIEIISAKPDWIEIRVPCDLDAVEPIQKFLTELEGTLPRDTREAIGSVFREMLNNAIEHGGKCDITKRVEVKYMRLKRAIIYSIKDPGDGFKIEDIQHAAVLNPEDNPVRHMQVRQEKGLRPGGFGILVASQVIDELLYNEKHNELIFVKYLDGI
ncbi:MAG TPA: response regulator [Blastocatellia bacterium]|jgi:CheY-like chemotaxis protein/anti-sigma regulatory factor (Ser/Thr protein kinase)|nr:response regulator [Blastocatellia bacterium]